MRGQLCLADRQRFHTLANLVGIARVRSAPTAFCCFKHNKRPLLHAALLPTRRRSLGHCAVVCSSWRQLASEDCLWQQHVPQEIHRPSLLSYSAKLEAGWPSALGANSKAISAAKAAACAIVESTATTPGNSNSNSNGSSTAAEASSSGQPAVACSGMLKPLFAAGVVSLCVCTDAAPAGCYRLGWH